MQLHHPTHPQPSVKKVTFNRDKYILKWAGRRKTSYSTLKDTEEKGVSEKQVLDSLEHAHSPIHLQFNHSKQPSRSRLYYNYFTFWKSIWGFFFPYFLTLVNQDEATITSYFK